MKYTGHSLEKSYLSAEMLLVYTTEIADWADKDIVMITIKHLKMHENLAIDNPNPFNKSN